MSREHGECDDNSCGESRSGSRGYAGRPNPDLADAFAAYQGFFVRQSELWYDVIGRFVTGRYRTEDASKDFARYLDGWTSEYQRAVQFPHRRAQAGQVPNVVFVLDDRAEGCAAKSVPITFTLGRNRPTIVATPLASPTGNCPAGSYVRGDFDARGEYASIQLVNARGLPSGVDSHFMCVVHTEASRLPIAVVHVVKRPAQREDDAQGAADGALHAVPRRWEQLSVAEKLRQLHYTTDALSDYLHAHPAASVDVARDLYEITRQHSRQIEDLLRAVAGR